MPEEPKAMPADDDPGPTDPGFWRGYRVERVGGTVYLSNEAGTEAFGVEMAEAYALAIIAEIHADDDKA